MKYFPSVRNMVSRLRGKFGHQSEIFFDSCLLNHYSNIALYVGKGLKIKLEILNLAADKKESLFDKLLCFISGC